jgi:hypothetical protein
MSRPQPPSVKYVYAVDYKSMIGGYRTLSVMNSVNPLLIPLRYLNHVFPWCGAEASRADEVGQLACLPEFVQIQEIPVFY